MMKARRFVTIGWILCLAAGASGARDVRAQVVLGAPAFRPATATTMWTLVPDGPPAIGLTPPITSSSRLIAVVPPGAITEGRSMTALSCVVRDGSTSGELFVRMYQIDPAAAKRTPTNLSGGQRLLAELRTGGTDRIDTLSIRTATNVREGLPTPYSSRYYYFLELSDSQGRPCNGDRLLCVLHSCAIRVE